MTMQDIIFYVISSEVQHYSLFVSHSSCWTYSILYLYYK